VTIANGSATFVITSQGTAAAGGGILSNGAGTLTVTSSVISGNSATAAASFIGGGGIANANSGTVNVSNTTISNNTTQIANAGLGGGIYNFGTGVVNVTNSSLLNNNARAGGGIANVIGGTLNVTNSTLSGNSTNREQDTGGGIENFGGTATITGSTFSGNTAASGIGGAIENLFFGTVTVSGCQFSGNSTLGTSGSGAGAAIGNEESTLTVTNCAFSNNMGDAAGVVNNQGTVSIANSTFSANSTSSQGGIILSQSISTPLTITNCTVSGNDSGILNFSGTTNLKNTLVALNVAFDVGGGFTSQGHNLIGKADGSTGFTNGVNGDQVGSMASPLDPKLGPLQNNGGPTATMALLSGSPAIDAADDSVLGPPLSLTTDQRGPGFPRKSGAHVDIGAFELQAAPIAFNTCLKDSSTGNLFQFNSANGQYKFTRCSDGFMISGTGVVQLVNGILTLTDSKPDRRVSAGFITSQRTGSATIYIMIAPGVWQTFRISSTNPNAVCGC
jgi:hypothetical protein